MTETSMPPVLVIDPKKHRIRFHRNTLYALNQPQFVQLLINPEKYSLVVKPCRKFDRCANKLRWEDAQCCELYSTSFIVQMCQMFGYSHDQPYRIIGEIIRQEHVTIFPLDKAIPMTTEESMNGEQ